MRPALTRRIDMGNGEDELERLDWTDARIQRVLNASKQSKLYFQIAERISAYLTPTSRVFSAGGGLGDLAIWLSYHVTQVTVIESDPKAAAAMRARCPHNVVVMLGDVSTYLPQKLFDALVLYDVGGAKEVMPLVRELARARTFLVYPLETPENEASVQELKSLLEETGIPASYSEFTFKHIQPLRSREDAKDYFTEEGRAVTEAELDALLAKTEDEELPYSLEENKKLGMIVFNAADPALKKPLF